jgi:hypothetical protein
MVAFLIMISLKLVEWLASDFFDGASPRLASLYQCSNSPATRGINVFPQAAISRILGRGKIAAIANWARILVNGSRGVIMFFVVAAFLGIAAPVMQLMTACALVASDFFGPF